MRAPRPGDPARIGRYEITGFLGEGGMGVVYSGRGPAGEDVAIKVVRADLARHPEFRARFRREAESAMRVPRFCTAEVLAADPDATEPYLVTEYIDGPTLNEVVKAGGPLRRAELDQLGVSMAAALGAIHAAGVTHRDLKPANVLLSRMGPRVIDFGIASAVDAVRLTAEGQTLGTPAYMAPEQLAGHAGPASDVFAWGGVMVFAATGRRPFGTGPLPEIAARITHGEPDLRGITGPLLEIIEAALAKDERLRPTAAGLLRMLGVSGTDPTAAVQTRLADLGLPDPTLSPTRSPAAGLAETRHDPYGPAGTEALAAGAAGPAAATVQDGVSFRFGRGVGPHPASPPDEATKIWRDGGTAHGGGTGQDTAAGGGRRTGRSGRPGRRRARSLISGALGLALFAGVAIWLILQNRTGDLKITGVRLVAANLRPVCEDARLTATITTNRQPGTLTYRWKLSDKPEPEAAIERKVSKGTETVSLPFLWQFTGHARQARYTATLTVGAAGEPPVTASTRFVYSCPR